MQGFWTFLNWWLLYRRSNNTNNSLLTRLSPLSLCRHSQRKKTTERPASVVCTLILYKVLCQHFPLRFQIPVQSLRNPLQYCISPISSKLSENLCEAFRRSPSAVNRCDLTDNPEAEGDFAALILYLHQIILELEILYQIPLTSPPTYRINVNVQLGIFRLNLWEFLP